MCFGNHRYDNKIDIWAIGCVFAELLTLKTLFHGGSEGCQFLEQVAILGRPTDRQLQILIGTKYDSSLLKLD